MTLTCDGCGRSDLQNERGIYQGRTCYTWAGKFICTECRSSGIRNPPDSLKQFFDIAGVRLEFNKDGSIIVPV